jgi:hypothetical protein
MHERHDRGRIPGRWKRLLGTGGEKSQSEERRDEGTHAHRGSSVERPMFKGHVTIAEAAGRVKPTPD